MRGFGEIRPKPCSFLWKKISKEFKYKKLKVIVVDDSLTNLKSAKKAGFTTVWATGFKIQKIKKIFLVKPTFVDYKIKHLDGLLSIDKKLRNFKC